MLIRKCSCAPIISAFEVQFGLDVRALQPDDPRLDRSPFMRRLLDSMIRISVLVVMVLIAIVFPNFVSYPAHPKRVSGSSEEVESEPNRLQDVVGQETCQCNQDTRFPFDRSTSVALIEVIAAVQTFANTRNRTVS